MILLKLLQNRKYEISNKKILEMNRSVQSIFESFHFRQMHTPFLHLPPLRRLAKHLIAQAEWLMLSHFDCHDKTSHVTLRCRSSSGSLESINSVSGSIFSSSICPKNWNLILFVHLIYLTRLILIYPRFIVRFYY